MKHLKTVWHWLSQREVQKTLAIVSAGLAVVMGGAWQAYLHFSGKPKDTLTPTVSASSGGIAAGGNVAATAAPGAPAIIATGNVTIGVTPEQYADGLKRREQEVRTEIRLSQDSAVDKKKIAQLEKQLADTQAKLENPKAALGDYKAILEQASKDLDHFKGEFSPKQLEDARQSLAKGDTKPAEMLFQQVFLGSGNKENAAKAAYQLGQLAYGRVDYEAADRYYRKAVDLQPDNPIYAHAQNQPEESLSITHQGNPIIKFSSREKDDNYGKLFELIVSYKGSEVYREKSSVDPVRDYEGKKRLLLEDTPKSGCQTIVAETFSGGAHCCTNDILGIRCGTDNYIMESINGGFLDDVDKDGVKELVLSNQSFDYYTPDKNHSLVHAASPSYIPHYALWTSRGWKITQPGDLKSVYKKLLDQTELSYQIKLSGQTLRRNAPVAMAIEKTYYALMAGEDEAQARKLLQSQLPKDWKGIANTVFLDIKKSISKVISGEYLTTIMANTDQSTSQ